MLPPQHKSETNGGDGVVSGDLGRDKRDWWLAYQRCEDFQAERCASANTGMFVNAF